eukprot:902912-Rhodomonas_salina.2
MFDCAMAAAMQQYCGQTSRVLGPTRVAALEVFVYSSDTNSCTFFLPPEHSVSSQYPGNIMQVSRKNRVPDGCVCSRRAGLSIIRQYKEERDSVLCFICGTVNFSQ